MSKPFFEIKGSSKEKRINTKAKNLRIEQKIMPVCVKADGEILYKIIDNLVSNAVKYADCNTKICLIKYDLSKGFEPARFMDISDFVDLLFL